MKWNEWNSTAWAHTHTHATAHTWLLDMRIEHPSKMDRIYGACIFARKTNHALVTQTRLAIQISKCLDSIAPCLLQHTSTRLACLLASPAKGTTRLLGVQIRYVLLRLDHDFFRTSRYARPHTIQTKRRLSVIKIGQGDWGYFLFGVKNLSKGFSCFHAHLCNLSACQFPSLQ